jgi:hypothetical protein
VSEHFGERPANTDGTLSVPWPMRVTKESFLSWVFGFGGECMVVAPPELARTLLDRAGVLRKTYDSR